MNCKYNVDSVNQFIQEHITDKGSISDGYHTFDEIYDLRKAYNAALFNEWGSPRMKYLREKQMGWSHLQEEFAKFDVHKSLRHHDGGLCFDGGWFIVVAELPSGQISNHYELKDWDLFKIPEVEKAKYLFDGHTNIDVIERLKKLY